MVLLTDQEGYDEVMEEFWAKSGEHLAFLIYSELSFRGLIIFGLLISLAFGAMRV